MNYSYIFNHIKSKLSTSIWLKLFIFFKAIILLHENNKELFTNTLLTSTRLQNIINVKGFGKREVVIVLIGITGPSGAGKGCVAQVFARRGFAVIDADRIAREIVMPGQPALAALTDAFGKDILLPDGSLDRRLLAQRAFSSEQGTKTLNEITHKEICKRMKALADGYMNSGRNCLFDAPLLIEAGLTDICNACVAVIASAEERTKRLMQRDGITEQEIQRRLSRQHSDDFYTSRCDYTIVNDGDLDRLREQADAIIERLSIHDGC